MKHDDLCSILIEKYYDPIYKYCYATLHYNTQAAEDCTQEIFFLLFKKRTVLNLHGNMRVWLYKTADRIMKNYIRKEKRYQEQIPIDDVEIPAPAETDSDEAASVRASLSQEEYRLLLAYYEAGHGQRKKLSARFGMTLQELYKRIDRIKQKVKEANPTINH